MTVPRSNKLDDFLSVCGVSFPLIPKAIQQNLCCKVSRLFLACLYVEIVVFGYIKYHLIWIVEVLSTSAVMQ